jgi:hypothetical protein
MYQAYVIKVSNVKQHPNADKLDVIEYNGTTYITGRGDFAVGDIAVLFPGDGKLSVEFLRQNNLYRNPELNSDPTKRGYFSNNGRVTTEKLRGICSYGLIVSLEAFTYLKVEFPYRPGDGFDSISGFKICEKYFTPETLRAMAAARNVKRTIRYDLAKHPDTLYLTFSNPPAGLVIITEKLHGTSGRTGKVVYKKIKPNLIDRIKSLFTGEKYMVVTGTRNTICVPGWAEYSKEERYRAEIHELLAPLLNKGETIFYEIVGFSSNNVPIMTPHSLENVKDKDFKKNYPNPIIYKYGETNYTFYVYRITQEIYNVTLEYTWDQVLNRCEQLDIKSVPELIRFYYEHTDDSLAEDVRITSFLTNSPSILDKDVLREGICIRVENRNPRIYKMKNFMFGVLEGWAKELDTYVDIEEVN